MSDILDQNEVDALLSGVASGEIETETDQPSSEMGDAAYDLTNPERVVRDKMPSLGVIHDKFIRLFQNSLSSLLRKDVDVQILNFEIMKYVRYVETIPLPSSMSILRIVPNDGVMILEMNSKIVFSLMDILCGGSGTERYKVEGRDFTSIEQRIIEKIVNLAAQDLVASWKPIVPLSLSLENIEVNPHFISVVERNETLVVYTFEVAIEQVTCSLKICLPYSSIEPFRVQLSGEMQSETVRKQDPAITERLRDNLKQMSVQVVVEVGHGQVTFRDLLHLQVGDVISLDRDQDSPCEVKCEGVNKFRGFPGQSKGKMAVQVASSSTKGGK